MTVNQRTKDVSARMQISVEWYCKIASYETLKLKAYLCPAGVPTIGYGHTKGVKLGDKITYEQANNLLREDIQTASEPVYKLGKLTQGQFDALVSFVFNVGEDKWNKSTLRKMVLANRNNPAIATEFKKWKYSKGKVLNGLIKRREDEAKRYFQ